YCPCFSTSWVPHSGQFSFSSTSGCSAFRVPAANRRVVLQSGYPEHARNAPQRPFLITISRPQLSQLGVSASPSPLVSGERSSMKPQSGLREKPRKNPSRLMRSSNSPCPHFSHFLPVGIPALYDSISPLACSRSSSKRE